MPNAIQDVLPRPAETLHSENELRRPRERVSRKEGRSLWCSVSGTFLILNAFLMLGVANLVLKFNKAFKHLSFCDDFSGALEQHV